MCSMSVTVVVRLRSLTARDALPDFLRGQPAVVPDDADHRNIDFRKDVGRHLQQYQGRREQNQQRHHQESVWPPQRNLNDPH